MRRSSVRFRQAAPCEGPGSRGSGAFVASVRVGRLGDGYLPQRARLRAELLRRSRRLRLDACVLLGHHQVPYASMSTRAVCDYCEPASAVLQLMSNLGNLPCVRPKAGERSPGVLIERSRTDKHYQPVAIRKPQHGQWNTAAQFHLPLTGNDECEVDANGVAGRRFRHPGDPVGASARCRNVHVLGGTPDRQSGCPTNFVGSGSAPAIDEALAVSGELLSVGPCLPRCARCLIAHSLIQPQRGWCHRFS